MRRRARAVGSVAAQASQALSSFLLTVVALRTLSPADFGVVAVLLGATVLATAVMTGVVGDSLTVLDRTSPRLRAGLQVCCVGIAVAVLLVAAAATSWSGLLPLGEALLYGAALAAFTVEDTARRLLMATLRFWSVVVVDCGYMLAAGSFLLWASATGRPLGVRDVIVALLVGQVVALVIGLALLPPAERQLAALRTADVRGVLSFGAWRALQQAIRPAALTGVRLLVGAVLGQAVLGGLEAARLYASPALLLVQGTGGFLLASYALERSTPTPEAVRRAARSALALVAASAALGAVLLGGLPLLGPLVSGGGTRIDPWTVAAWGAYAAGIAAIMPFSSLAAVRGRQARVVGLRFLDTAVSLTLVVVAVVLVGQVRLVPLAMALGSLAGVAFQRRAALAGGGGAAAEQADVRSG